MQRRGRFAAVIACAAAAGAVQAAAATNASASAAALRAGTIPQAATLSSSSSSSAADQHGKNFFVATTSASAVTLQTTQKPASSIITADLVDDSLGYTATAFDSTDGSEAQAASVYPGTLVTQGPALLCSEGILPFSCPVTPPAYPLLADASYPQHPHASAGGDRSAPGVGKLLRTEAGSAVADARSSSATGRATLGSASLVPGALAGFTVGSESSTTHVTTTANAVLVHVTSRASNIDVGGLLRIGSVTGTVVQHIKAGHAVLDHPSVTVAGLTVAGQKATVGRHGVTVAGTHGPAILRRLDQRGITINPTTISRQDSKRGARSDVTGLIITAKQPLAKAPYIPNPLASVPPFNQIPGVDLSGTYVTRIQLGSAGSAAGIEHQAGLGLGSIGGPLPVNRTAPPANQHNPSRPSTVSGRSHKSGGSRVGPITQPTTPGKASTVTPAGGSPVVAGPVPRAFHGFLDSFDLDLDSLYLVIALGGAGLFIGWRLRVATRTGLLANRARISRTARRDRGRSS